MKRTSVRRNRTGNRNRDAKRDIGAMMPILEFIYLLTVILKKPMNPD